MMENNTRVVLGAPSQHHMDLINAITSPADVEEIRALAKNLVRLANKRLWELGVRSADLPKQER